MQSEKSAYPPIAIIGMGLRLPGGITTPAQFWKLLIEKKDGRCRVPPERYNVDAFHGDNVQQQNVASEFGYFLDHVNLQNFDATFFSAKRTEVEVTDPQQRLLLEVVWECLESAGQAELRGTRTGVYVGVFGEDWHNMLHRDEQAFSAYRVLSAGDYALANRLSYEYDFRGPSMTVRTACSASLSGLHLACQALQSGDCDTAIVAGSSIIMDPSMTIDMSQQGVLSPTGSCKTFDAAADGFARGEAVNAILIKPLDKALSDGDPIRAVIRSTAVNSDGKTSHMGSPSTESQEAMIRHAYKMAGIDDFSQTPFFECHGTGTPVGDPLEVAAVANVFGDSWIYIGSVKPNVGHGEGASGLTSIIKAVLALENQTIPPNINFQSPNPKIPFKESRLIVPVEPVSWPQNRYARVSVNSFGIGGANAHVILDSAAAFVNNGERIYEQTDHRPSKPDSLFKRDADSRKIPPGKAEAQPSVSDDRNLQGHDVGGSWPSILPVSANSSKSLHERIESLQKYIADHPDKSTDLSYTLGLRRSHLPYRSYCIVQDGVVGPLQFQTVQKSHNRLLGEAGIAFVFTGQGAQWKGMAKSLLSDSESFREDIRKMDSILQELPEAPKWSLEGMLSSSTHDIMIDHAEFSQPLCTAIQIALVNVLAKCGIIPVAVLGHSSGEIAAAYAAGGLTISKAIACAYLRGQAIKRTASRGAMAAIGMGQSAAQHHLVGDAQVACENSSKSVTISGSESCIKETLKSIKTAQPETFVKVLPIKVAYHSDHMREAAVFYEEILATAFTESDGTPHIPFYSTVSGDQISGKSCFGPPYWGSNLQRPVLFQGAVNNMLTNCPMARTILEIGPHSSLQAPLRQIIQEKASKAQICYIPTLIRDSDATMALLDTVGRLYMAGHPVDFSFLNPRGSVLTDLPNYPWDYSSEFWKETRVSQAWRFRKHKHHELLGSRSPEATELEAVWRNIIHESDVDWLKDHKVGTDTVFPCAGYIAMMGEALRQTTGSESYVLRNLMVKAALVLPEVETIEILTVMRPSRVTELSNSSRWYDISISTFNGTIWIENCAAQGSANDATEGDRHSEVSILPRSRQITASSFYQRIGYLGMRYGPRFQLLEDISADPHQFIGTASIIPNQDNDKSQYAVHPALIDVCLQLYAVAGCQGIPRRLDSLVLPIDIRRIAVNPGSSPMIAEASLDPINMTGKVTALNKQDGRRLIDLTDAKGIPFDVGLRNDETFDLARLEWLPHIDYVNLQDVIRRRDSKREARFLLEKIAILGILLTLNTIDSLHLEPTGHLAKYIEWLENEKGNMVRGNREVFASEPQSWVSMSPAEWNRLMDGFVEEIERSADLTTNNIARLIRDTAHEETVRKVFMEEANALEDMLQDNRLVDFYRLQTQLINTDDFFKLCGHAKPTMKILEIGAGTGSATEQILPCLISDGGVRMYSEYVFTDVSPGFFSLAKDRFKDTKNIVFKTLDIEKDIVEQGFEVGTFDLIVASNVLHATSSLQTSLRNVRSLVRDGGWLYLGELVKPHAGLGVAFITGRLPGWWVGEEDGRSEVPYVSVERWDEELRKAGFSGTEVAVLDDDTPYQMCAHITSRAVTAASKVSDITLLYYNEKPEFARRIADLLDIAGVEVTWARFRSGDYPSESQHILSVMDLENPFLDDMSRLEYGNLVKFLSGLKGGILWLTRPAQLGCTDPRYGVVNGLARTVRVELAIDFWTIELQHLDDVSAEGVLSLCQRFCVREPLKHGVDTEFCIRDGTIHVGRYHWKSLPKAIESPIQKHESKQMIIGQYGMLDSLHWVQSEPKPPPHANEVEVTIHSDVMVAMGIVPKPKDDLGFEATGIVTQVGSDVDHVEIGDRVFIVDGGLFSTRKVVKGHCVARIPASLTLEEAVTMPVVYATAMHALITLGQLQKGQSVLIHSGAGGVGQAAIHICQMLDAEIYVTVGSEKKVEYLTENFNISRQRIFDSHSTKFLQDIMQATGGRGVDLVLNSLSGELLHASWKCVAKYGKMMEIGKRDILEHGHIPLDMFQNNRTFYGIDMESLFHERPELMQSSIQKLQELSAQHHAKPIKPIQVFEADKISEAFRFMKKGEHIGKIAVTIPRDASSIAAAKSPASTSLSESLTYLVVGGLGGLGKAVTRWMVEKGARKFCFLSRSAGTSEKDQSFLQELESQGCQTVAIAGSVAKAEDVRKAIDLSPTRVGGVLQMSMVIRDRPMLQMSYDDWRIVHDCKVKGTWNLHNELQGVPLDFFILMSSISGSVGHPGQANYTSANTFLDSFAQYRQNLGLPCTVVDLGGMGDIGFLSERPEKLNQYRSFGLYILTEQHLLEAIELAMQPIEQASILSQTNLCTPLLNSNQFVVGLNTSKPLSDPTNRALYKGDPRVSMYNNMTVSEQTPSSGRDESMREFLSQAEANPEILNDPETLKRASWEIGRTLFSFLLLPEEDLDITLSLSSIGIDSLVSIEIRNWWRKMLGLNVTVLEIMNAGTIEGLGKMAITSLKEKYGVNQDSNKVSGDSSNRE